MINGKDYWCFTVMGPPVTKKRARTNGAIHFTFDSWYDKMVGDAFCRAYPNMKPIGHEHYNTYNRKGTICYRMKSTSSKEMLPKVRIFMIVYTNNNVGDDDNYVKTILDALNKKLYVDDCQVCVPTPRVVSVENKNAERVEILAVSYNQTEDKGLTKLQSFFDKHSKVIDIYDEYENIRLAEHTMTWLYNHLCKPKGCPKFDECNMRRKMDIIECEFRDTITEDMQLISLNCRKRSCLCKQCANDECYGMCSECDSNGELTSIKDCDDFIEQE